MVLASETIYKMLNDLGPISTFCTLTLFVLFWGGKIWTHVRSKELYNVKVEIIDPEDNEEFNKQIVLGESQVIKISSPDGIYDIILYDIIGRKRNLKAIKKPVSKTIEDYMVHPYKLDRDEAFYIWIDLPCGMPNYSIKIVQYDYVTMTAELGENGKVGGLCLNGRKIKRGLRGVLYDICK